MFPKASLLRFPCYPEAKHPLFKVKRILDVSFFTDVQPRNPQVL